MSYGVKNAAVGNPMPSANRAGQEWVREANGQRPQQGQPMKPGCLQDPTRHPLPIFLTCQLSPSLMLPSLITQYPFQEAFSKGTSQKSSMPFPHKEQPIG